MGIDGWKRNGEYHAGKRINRVVDFGSDWSLSAVVAQSRVGLCTLRKPGYGSGSGGGAGAARANLTSRQVLEEEATMDESKRRAVQFLEKEIKTYTALSLFLSKRDIKEHVRISGKKILLNTSFYKERMKEAKKLVSELKTTE
jgi:hypothetical protein